MTTAYGKISFMVMSLWIYLHVYGLQHVFIPDFKPSYQEYLKVRSVSWVWKFIAYFMREQFKKCSLRFSSYSLWNQFTRCV